MKDFPLISVLFLIYWGVNTGNTVLAVLFATALESARLVRLRFDFKEKDFNNISMITTLSLAGYLIYYVNANREAGPIYALLQFLPISLFPLNFFFIYSTSAAVNAKRLFLLFVVNKYSIVNRYIKYFRPDYLFIAALIVGGSVRIRPGTDILLYASVLILLLKFRAKRSPNLKFVLLILLSALITAVLQFGMYHSFTILKDVLTDIYIERYMKYGNRSYNIGRIGGYKDSYRIDIRAEIFKPSPGGLLLRDRVLNTYSNGTWTESNSENIDFYQPYDIYFSNITDSVRIYYFSSGRSSSIKLPFRTFAFAGLETGKLSFGSSGNINSGYTQHLIDYKAYTRKDSLSGIFPHPAENDLQFIPKDSVYTDNLIEHLGLKEMTVPDIFRALRDHFISDYSYSLDYIDLKDSEKLKYFIVKKNGGIANSSPRLRLLFTEDCIILQDMLRVYLVTEYDETEEIFLGRRKDRHAMGSGMGR